MPVAGEVHLMSNHIYFKVTLITFREESNTLQKIYFTQNPQKLTSILEIYVLFNEPMSIECLLKPVDRRESEVRTVLY